MISAEFMKWAREWLDRDRSYMGSSTHDSVCRLRRLVNRGHNPGHCSSCDQAIVMVTSGSLSHGLGCSECERCARHCNCNMCTACKIRAGDVCSNCFECETCCTCVVCSTCESIISEYCQVCGDSDTCEVCCSCSSSDERTTHVQF